MSTPLPAAVPAPAQARTSMDELMLAMDIVDTLRHEQSLVERELASNLRDDAFVARVKQIYASQGIEVTDALIRKGVQELKQDRFAYVPPARTFAVRLAEVWVDRWRWAKRSLIAGFVVAIGAAVVVLPNRLMAEREYSSYRRSVSELRESASELQRRDQALAKRVGAWPTPADAVVAPVTSARAAIELAHGSLSADLPILATTAPLAASAFAEDPDAARKALQAPLATISAIDGELDRLETRARETEALLGASARLARIDAQLAGASMSDAATARIAEQRSVVEASLRSGDGNAAGTGLEQLERAANEINLAYSLRIVNREGVQSGVWRYHDDAPGGKNYYLVVEALDASGQVLSLPVTNEETQQTQTVSRFAIRVPESEYERVKADKKDNGLIDDVRVGDKRRGEIDVEYHVNVAGGAITDW